MTDQMSPRTPAHLIDLARHGLTVAALDTTPAARFASAYMAARRAAAALLAAHGRQAGKPGYQGVWDLLVEVAPQWRHWRSYFNLHGETTAAAEAGIPGAVNEWRHADDLLRAATVFTDAAVASLTQEGHL